MEARLPGSLLETAPMYPAKTGVVLDFERVSASSRPVRSARLIPGESEALETRACDTPCVPVRAESILQGAGEDSTPRACEDPSSPVQKGGPTLRVVVVPLHPAMLTTVVGQLEDRIFVPLGVEEDS